MVDIDFSDYFYYDETSPSCLRWKSNRYWGRNNSALLIAAGAPVGWVSDKGYWMTETLGQQWRVHNIIWNILRGAVVGVVDHLDGDTSNNLITNLCDKSRVQNLHNRKMPFVNTSGVMGVKWDNKRSKSSLKESWYAVAFWNDLSFKQKCKSFSVKVHGLLPAFAKAVAHRESQIQLLNEQGAGYTERHGT